ncbi:MAG: helix-turn-helix transcriptional regulator [Acidobacteriota bacterium]|nr:helix-turn-helix transcriptional regulator [Acidobacteriota bacterium]
MNVSSKTTYLTPRKAAEMLGISYPTAKHWILTGKIKTMKTPGGHHRIPLSELDSFLPRQAGEKKNTALRLISGRNQLMGRVVEVTIQGFMAKVVLSVGEQTISAIITAEAVEDLGLRPGDVAVALIKSTEVMIARQ